MIQLTSKFRPSICFVCPEVSSALVNCDNSRANGAELQQTLIARQLAAEGYAVSFVTEDCGQADGADLDGIRVFKAYRRSAGLRYVRFIHPRMTGLWSAMKRSDADIYFQRTSDVNTGVVAAFCGRHRRRFVFSVASDANCLGDLSGCVRHERAFYRYGLRRADCVIAQTSSQKLLLRENFAVESTVIPNCGLDWGGKILCSRSGPSSPPRRMVWIGRWVRVKRLEMLLDVAERMTDVEFDIIGQANSHSPTAYTGDLQDRLASLANVHVHGRVPHEQLGGFYEKAGALICTSLIEGFPNTFVEAWRHGLPVISTFDPDDFIAQKRLGYIAPDAAGLAERADRLLGSSAQWREVSVNARRHFLSNHSVAAVIPRFRKVFDDLMTQAQDESRQPVGRPAA